MFDVPLDAWYAWVGLGIASVAVLAVATSLPSAPPPDAAGLADTIERTASADYEATAEHPVSAKTVRLSPRRVSLRNTAGTTQETFAFGAVTPAHERTRLRRVLDGTPANSVFETPEALLAACRRAQSKRPTWQRVDGPIRVRHLTWEGVDVTLVGV